jgi:hypothetical protein
LFAQGFVASFVSERQSDGSDVYDAMTIASSAMRVYNPYLIYRFVSISAHNEILGRTHLSEIRRPRIKVHLLVNLIVPRQRVHDNHVRLCALEHLVIHHK